MKSEEIKIFGLVIIESLNETDKKTGTILHEEAIKYKKFQEPNLSSFLYTVKTKEALFKTLDAIIQRIKVDKLFPFLHFETHGCDEGIRMASGEVVTWKELLIKTRKINILLGNELVLFLAMCNGTTIIGKMKPLERAPFLAIISTVTEINENDLLKAFEAFYNHYFFSFNPKESLDLMNVSLNGANPKFNLLTASYCFDGIVNPDRDPKHFQATVLKHAEREKAENPTFKDKDLNEIKIYTEQRLRTILEEAKNKKDYFLMKDLQTN